jgi:hypothetical protein
MITTEAENITSPIKKLKLKNFFNTGNFTQSVWKGSKEIGIGYAWNEDKNQNFVVATFLPKGNRIGEYPVNVLPIPKGE